MSETSSSIGVPEHMTGRMEHAVTVVSCLGLAAFYAMALSPFSFGVLWSDDGMFYARWLAERDLRELAHPHHVLYHVLALVGYDTCSAFLGGGIETAIRVSTWMSALGGAASVYLLVRTARRLGASPIGAHLLGACLAFSHAHWAFSSVPETYLPAQAVLWFVIWRFVDETAADPDKRTKRTGNLVYAVALAFAWTLRSDSAFFLLPLAVGFVARDGWRTGVRRMAVIGIVTAVLALVVHAIVWANWVAPEPSFAAWLRGYAEKEYGAFDGYLGTRLPAELAGFARSVASPSSPATQGAVWIASVLLACGLTAFVHPVWKPIAALAGTQVLLRLFFFAWWEPGQFDFGPGHAAALALGLVPLMALRMCALRVVLALGMLLYVLWQGRELVEERLPRYADRSEHARIVALDDALLEGDAIAGDSRWVRIGFRAWTDRTVLELAPDTFLEQLDAWLEEPGRPAVVVPADEFQALLLRPSWTGHTLSETRRAERIKAWDAFFREHPPGEPTGRGGRPLLKEDGSPQIVRFLPVRPETK